MGIDEVSMTAKPQVGDRDRGCLLLWVVGILLVLQPVLRPGNGGAE